MPTQPHTASGDPAGRRSATPAEGEPTEKNGGGFRRLWRGQQPLGDAFWYHFVLGQIIAYFVGAWAGGVSAALFGEERAVIAISIFGLLVPVLYLLFTGVGVWRSASGRGVLGILARVIVFVELSAWLFAIGGLFYAAVQGAFPAA
jgi:hypothetical protein